MHGIFINYRRGQQQGFAGRVYDRIRRDLRRARPFMDVADLSPGSNFVHALAVATHDCVVMLVLIGDGWLEVSSPVGLRRLDLETDFVRQEITWGLQANKCVIPVLLDSVDMPREHELPAPLRPLAHLHAVRIRHESFDVDCEKLIRRLRAEIEAFGAPWSRWLRPKEWQAWFRQFVETHWPTSPSQRALAGLTMALLVVLAGTLTMSFRSPPPSPPAVSGPQVGRGLSMPKEPPAYQGAFYSLNGSSLVLELRGKRRVALQLYGVVDSGEQRLPTTVSPGEFIAGAAVKCWDRYEDERQRHLCFAGEIDLAAWALGQGLVRPSLHAPQEYRRGR